jgi:UDP-N-acetylglucosamine 4-epimerase
MYENPFHIDSINQFSFLVTGGASFIGSNLVEYLLKYNAKKVVVLDNLATGFEENIQPYLSLPNFEFIKGDICNADDCAKACKNTDYVLHQAAFGSVPRSIENPIATHNANATGFVNMLIAARDAKVKRLVYASSSSVYGDSEILPKKEDYIGKPLSPYAVSKLVNEFYADIFSHTYGMEIIGLRYFNIFGPRQNPKGAYAAAIPLFIESLKQNKPLFINGNGEQTRDFTFVENAVQGNIKALFTTKKEAIGKVFNIAVSEKISVNKLFSILKQLTNSSLNPTYREQRQGDVKESLADISLAETLLNYSPKIKVEQGLKITVDCFK